MSVRDDTVHDRLDRATNTLTPLQLLGIVALVAAAGFTLLFLQEPLVHDALHDFRHSVGITCH